MNCERCHKAHASVETFVCITQTSTHRNKTSRFPKYLSVVTIVPSFGKKLTVWNPSETNKPPLYATKRSSRTWWRSCVRHMAFRFKCTIICLSRSRSRDSLMVIQKLPGVESNNSSASHTNGLWFQITQPFEIIQHVVWNWTNLFESPTTHRKLKRRERTHCQLSIGF